MTDIGGKVKQGWLAYPAKFWYSGYMRTLKAIKFWTQCWFKESYAYLWYEVHGDWRDEGGKGLRRERAFSNEIHQMTNNAWDNEKLLRQEAEQALTEAGIPIPREERYNKMMEKYK